MGANILPAAKPITPCSTMEQRHDSTVMAEDPFISSLVRAVLRRQGYSVTLAAPAEVIRLLRRREPSAGILVTNSPGSFQEFAGAMRFVYLSSSPDPRLAALFPSCRVRKPFAPEELVRAVEELELH